jgi:CRP-like cAMP-binding protein
MTARSTKLLDHSGPCAPAGDGAVEQGRTANELLRRLAPADFALLQPHLTRVPLTVGSILASAGAGIDTVCFPEGGIVGFVDVLADQRRLAVGLIGREGVVGWPLLLGTDRWPHEAAVRAENSTAVQIDSGRLLEAAQASDTLRSLLLRFVNSFVAQMSRTIVSNLIHPVEARAARWILLYHDRVSGDEIAVTHEEFAIMLGVRRSSITDALHQLEGGGAIRGLRGRILVRDRDHLQSLVTDTYGFAEAEYRRLMQ